jgi:hypothetical protein
MRSPFCVPDPNFVYYDITLLSVCLCAPIFARQRAVSVSVPPPNSFVFFFARVV